MAAKSLHENRWRKRRKPAASAARIGLGGGGSETAAAARRRRNQSLCAIQTSTAVCDYMQASFDCG